MSISKKINRIEKLNDKIALLCEEIKEELEQEGEFYEEFDEDDEDLEEED